ncbi:MAG: type II secretion system protein [bacterium]|nr:type II secretion system protein [bacterium]
MQLIPKNRGFTLLEMIVSISIFTIVALVAVGSLLKVVDANKKAQSLKTSINNINFALDSISREMRVGRNYYCSPGLSFPSRAAIEALGSAGSCGPITSGSWTVAFKSSQACLDDPKSNRIFAYQFDSSANSGAGMLKKAEQKNCVDSPSFDPIISPDIKFNEGGVAGIRVVRSPDIQSYAQFHFRGYAGTKEKIKTYFDLQTTVSPRLTD